MGMLNPDKDEEEFFGRFAVDDAKKKLKEDRRRALDVANWIERDLQSARSMGEMSTRGLVQNVELIIAALREYANVGERKGR